MVLAQDNVLKYGELLLTAGMDLADGTSVLKSVVSLFDVVDVSPDGFIKCAVASVASQVDASSILAALTYSMSPDSSSCIMANPD